MRWGREYIKVGERRDNLVQCGCCSASQSVVFSSTGVCFFVCVRACVRGPSVSFVCFFLSGRASVVLRFGQRRGPKRHSHGADLDRNDIVNVLPSWCFFFLPSLYRRRCPVAGVCAWACPRCGTEDATIQLNSRFEKEKSSQTSQKKKSAKIRTASPPPPPTTTTSNEIETATSRFLVDATMAQRKSIYWIHFL